MSRADQARKMVEIVVKQPGIPKTELMAKLQLEEWEWGCILKRIQTGCMDFRSMRATQRVSLCFPKTFVDANPNKVKAILESYREKKKYNNDWRSQLDANGYNREEAAYLKRFHQVSRLMGCRA